MQKSSFFSNLSLPLTFLLTLIILVGCLAESSNRGVFQRQQRQAVPATVISLPEPIDLTLAELAENYQAYLGLDIQITGQYQTLPIPDCNGNLRPSPATWQLVNGDNIMLAGGGGFDNLLRPLAAQNLTITIAGRWTRWVGPVGCGKQSAPTEVWYLHTTEIVAPNPLVRGEEVADNTPLITATPAPTTDPNATEVSQLPPTMTNTPEPNATPTPLPTNPPTPPPTNTPLPG
ncbi:MAG TPA: hypothetical protein VLL52_23780, partial [Anaerolineae bacterium]|nr:hypothetical protein [Anaerolineae bacterium]